MHVQNQVSYDSADCRLFFAPKTGGGWDDIGALIAEEAGQRDPVAFDQLARLNAQSLAAIYGMPVAWARWGDTVPRESVAADGTVRSLRPTVTAPFFPPDLQQRLQLQGVGEGCIALPEDTLGVGCGCAKP